MQPALEITYRAPGELAPYARNARTHSPEQIAQIAASITEFGFTNPILVDAEGVVIAGHGRLAAANRLGLERVPVVVLEHLSEAQRRAYVLADNKLAEFAGWDEELLALELGALQDLDYDPELAGFSAAELASIVQAAADAAPAIVDPDADPDAPDPMDEIPAPEAQVVTRPGDIWQLGAHRLICGDAGAAGTVEALMQGEPASLCFTSPPYAMQRDYISGGISDWDALMRGVFGALPMAPAGQVLVNLGLVHRDNEFIAYWNDWLEWMRRQGWRRFAWYTWDQGPGLPGNWNGRLAPSFEFVFHFNRESRQPNKIVRCKNAGLARHQRPDGTSAALRGKDGKIVNWQHAGRPTQATRIPDSVIRIQRQCGAIGQDIAHPAVFPVALPEFVLQAYSDPGDIVFEPFSGSGTTLLAAERTGRCARAVELAPQYVDVAIKRFRQHYPALPVVLGQTGEAFDAVAARRVERPAQAQA